MRNLSFGTESLLDYLGHATAPALIEASSEASADTQVENLATDDLGEVWRSGHVSESPLSGYIVFDCDTAGYQEVGVVALANVNLLSASRDNVTGELTSLATWRVRAGTAPFFPFPSPASIAAKSGNLSGAYTDLTGDPYALVADSSWVTCSDNLANDIRVTFDGSSGNYDLTVGAGLQKAVALVRRKASGGTHPSVEIQLWHSGALVASLGSTAITSLTGQVIEGAFNASLVSGWTGSGLQIKLIATAGSTTTVEYGAIRGVLEFETSNGNTLYDSGALTPTLPSLLGRTPMQLIHALPTAMTAQRVIVELIDSANADGYLEAGYLHIGPLKTTGINVDYGCSWAFEDPSILSETPGGRLMAEERPLRRVFSGQFAAVLTQTEALDTLFDQLDRRVGLTKLMVLIQDADDTTQYHNTAGFGRLRSLDPVALARFQRYSRTISFVEAVA